jgi:hypothetical protein
VIVAAFGALITMSVGYGYFEIEAKGYHSFSSTEPFRVGLAQRKSGALLPSGQEYVPPTIFE